MIRQNDETTQKDIESSSKIPSYHYICEDIKARSTIIEMNINLKTSSISIIDNGDEISSETFNNLGLKTINNQNMYEETFLSRVCHLCNSKFISYADLYKYEKTIDLNGQINVKDRASNDRYCNGLEIHLNDIFKNLPSCDISNEISLIIQIIERISILHPFISFILYDSNESKLLYSIKPHSKILNRYLSLYSNDSDNIYSKKSNLIEFNIEDKPYCNGIISSLNNENNLKLYKQYLYVNQHPVECKDIESILNKEWKNRNKNCKNKLNYVIDINLDNNDYVIIPSCDNLDKLHILFTKEELEILIYTILNRIYNNHYEYERKTVNMNEYLNIDIGINEIDNFIQYKCDDLYNYNIFKTPIKRYYSIVPSPYYHYNDRSSDLTVKWDNILGVTIPICDNSYYLERSPSLPTAQQQQQQILPISEPINQLPNDYNYDDNYIPILLTKEEYREYKQLLKQPWLIPLQSEQSIEQPLKRMNNIIIEDDKYDDIINQFEDYEQCEDNKIYENNDKYKHNKINIKSYLTPSTVSTNRKSRKRRRISSSSDKFNFSKNNLKNCQIIGQFDKKFILFHYNNILFAIDQHAADERVHLEEYESIIISSDPQQIMNEIDIFESSVINDRLYYILNENKDLIERRGFKYNIKYNENKERIIELTKTMSIINTVVHLDSLISYLEQLEKCNNKCINENEIPEYLHNILKSKACRNAIMFNDELSIEQCKELILKLSECNYPFMCAHGRPSIHPLFSLKENMI